MKKILLAISAIVSVCLWCSSCKDTKSYADLVRSEEHSINDWIKNNPFNIEFGHITTKGKNWLDVTTERILNDSVHPCQFIELGKWYTFNESDFKRLYFCILDWGEDGVTDYNDEEQLRNAMRSKKKFRVSHNAMVRYDSLFLLTDFDYSLDPEKQTKGDNLDPNSYMIVYNWQTNYYATTYYGNYYGTGSSYECTSGGLGFPLRYLWEGGRAAIICPFSLADTQFQSYYYTFYYGDILYKRPNYLPQ
ncbi:MAG: DUF4827 family protein [Bacteroidales bacterium]|nr:DUF4827 family protein [Bacteroidales bacterium]